MPKASINGIELYYKSHGEGPAITFAHGRGGNRLSWWQQVPVFSKDYRCITSITVAGALRPISTTARAQMLL